MKTITFSLLILLIALLSASGRTKFNCEIFGDCEDCSLEEMQDASYCKATGKRAREICTSETGHEIDEFVSCGPLGAPSDSIDAADNDDVGKVIIFQVFMALFGGLAFWGVQLRKRSNMSLFDTRKLRASNGRL